MNCDHLTWLRLSDAQDVTLIDTGRLTRLISELANPSSQRPTLLLFLGRKAKQIALKEIFPWNNIKKGINEGIITLRIETLSIASEHPILFAESDPFKPIISQPEPPAYCHDVATIPLEWTKSVPNNLFDIIHARLFCLFIDVLCIFADDFKDFQSVIDKLKTWASLGRPSVLFKEVRPKVIIVKRGNGPGPSPTYDLLESEDLHYNLHQKPFTDFFSSITVLHLADQQISPLARHRRLKELIQRQVDEMRHLRLSYGCLYSALHLNHFFKDAVKHTAQTVEKPFSFILSSRKDNHIEDEYVQHLENFLQLSVEQNISLDILSSYMASTMLVDAYPPDMHKFDPMIVYAHLYEPVCAHSLKLSYEKLSSIQHQNQCIKDYLIDMFAEMQEFKKSAKCIHKEVVSKLKIPWSKIFNNRTCMWCLRRKPENILTCGHAICDTCVRVFGNRLPNVEYRYKLESCLLCLSGALEITMKPPTAGVRILSIDGGGSRGVVPLEFLSILQDMVGLDCPIQDFFDLAFGTSSGGLIVLSLFLRRWGVAQCAEVFDRVTRQLFRAERQRANVFRTIRRILQCWLSDGCYDVEVFETLLKENFENQQRMFDSLQPNPGAKVAVTATTISDAFPFVFSNYNGIGTRHPDSGYEHFRPTDTEDELCIWEAARATSAAPILFRPAQIRSVGTFQDGGLRHNNPINLALWESRYIWPAIDKPDIVLSLGTGVEKEALFPRAPNFRNLIQDGFISRLKRSFISLLTGQGPWRELWNRLDDRAREDYFRLNIFFPGEAPPMDDVNHMEELRECVHLQPNGDTECQKVAFALLVSTLFFELNSIPIFSNGKYHCQGTIRCRLQGTVICEALTRIHPMTLTFMTDSEVLGYFDPDQDLCRNCHQFKKHVEFVIRHPNESTTLFMQSVLRGKRKISGFPQNMQWFIAQQRLDSPFGWSSIDYRLDCDGCKKRKSTPIEDFSRRKRVRLA